MGIMVQMLKATKEFDFVYKNSYKFRTDTLDICVLKPHFVAQFYVKFGRIPNNFVGFSVSKKVGIAVERNLIKRRLRTICREFFKVANLPCSDFLWSASSHSLQRTSSASHLLTSHNPKDLSTMLEFADSKDLNKLSLRKSALAKSRQSKKLICIFITKSGILQMPFGVLKESIFATLKRQINVGGNLHKNHKNDFCKNSHKNSHNKNANLAQYNANKGHLQ